MLNDLATKSSKNSYLGLDKKTRIPGILEHIINGESGNYFLIKGAEGSDPIELKPTELILQGSPEKYPKALVLTKRFLTGKKNDKKYLGALVKEIKDLNTAKGPGTPTKRDRVKIKGSKGDWGGQEKNFRGVATYTLEDLQKTKPLGGQAGGDPYKTKPSTATQERVTLEIFKILLEGNNYDAPKDAALAQKHFNNFCVNGGPAGGPLGDIWKGLARGKGLTKKSPLYNIPSAAYTDKEAKQDFANMRSWYYHFLLQFKFIEARTDLPDNKFDVFDYDVFMQFITDIILAGHLDPAVHPSQVTSEMKLNTQLVRHKKWPKFGTVSKKDSWNPADIWLLHKTRAEKWIKKIKLAQNVAGLNDILEKAFNDNAIVGISLKKSSAGSSPRTHEAKTQSDLFYSKVNFSVGGEFEPLNRIRFGGWKFNLKWIESTNKKKPSMFEKITNELKIYEVNSNGKKIPDHSAEMRIGSSQSGVHNINLEYKPTGGAAQLGKIPKKLLSRLIAARIPGLGINSLPTWENAEKSIPTSSQDSARYNAMKIKIDWVVKWSQMPGSGFTCTLSQLKTGGKYPFIKQVMSAKNDNPDLWEKNVDDVKKNVLMGIQIMEWASILAQAYMRGANQRVPLAQQGTHQQRFNTFLMDTYYFAQKKGPIFGSRFGPFGKLH